MKASIQLFEQPVVKRLAGPALVFLTQTKSNLIEISPVQVVGVDLPAGPKAVAFVVAKSQVSEDAIRMRCRQELAAYKVPIRVFQIDEFPTTSSANGVKIQKTRLRDIALVEIT